MVNFAEKLSQPFPFVRVDFYEYKKQPLFGELTFYPGNGMEPFTPREWDYKIGEYFNLPSQRPLVQIGSSPQQSNLICNNASNLENHKGVIYTCITGNYDSIPNHDYISDEWDYICFIDKIPKNPENYHWQFFPLAYRELDDFRNSRWHKLHPHELFKNYKKSIWIDANIRIINKNLFEDIKLVEKISSRMSIGPHFERDNIYDEIEACIELGKDSEETLEKHRIELLKTGFSGSFGHFYENNIIYRKHHDEKIISVMDDWWWWITHYSRRDQLSLVYVLWKHINRSKT